MNKGKVILAVESESEKLEIEIGFHELIKFLEKVNVLTPLTAQHIRDINSLRNTFHFRKERIRPCGVADVESALALLAYTLEHTPRFIKK